MTLARQESFNINWDWFIVQGQPQSIAREKCMYRSPAGGKCAIGCVIPDKLYSPDLERWGIRDILDQDNNMYLLSDEYAIATKKLKEANLFNEEDIWFYCGLQHAHDKYDPTTYEHSFTEYIKKQLTDIAKQEGLTISGE